MMMAMIHLNRAEHQARRVLFRNSLIEGAQGQRHHVQRVATVLQAACPRERAGRGLRGPRGDVSRPSFGDDSTGQEEIHDSYTYFASDIAYQVEV